MSHNIVREKVEISNLKIGMYVCDLDRPWLETPYPLQGFSITSYQEIQELDKHCSYVYIDVKRTFENELKGLDSTKSATFSKHDKQFINKKKHIDSHSMEEEVPQADKHYEFFSINTQAFLDGLKNGQQLDIKSFKESTKQMVESVVRNPDAMLWLVRLKRNDDYMYQHSLCCSVLAVAFGRQLGLNKRQLNNLAIGAALLDIGKLKLPKTLLNRPGKLCDDEFEMIRDHVRLSLDMIVESGNDSKDVLEMVATHHERMNGRGYPNQLVGEEIPLFGRIAAIVDCYDAISTKRSYANALSPAEAVKKLYEWRDVDFHAPLVEVFIQALGIYPAGSMVELSTGEVGVVMSEYRTRRLRPKIILILDQDKRMYEEFPTIDLFKLTENSEGVAINIKQSLEPGSYGINPSELMLG